ncbi:Inner membrane assembly complex subunit 17 [Lachnellula cervina]|uniref:Inner membrane assembly complex subunit 17 n=1 Tax=Lachnellula cervina TaxID=1316786 RepID=A0A7D8UX85_9HELO|nr:Inner membrane assembly complex subunit 17 [Lachnellula cervina]
MNSLSRSLRIQPARLLQMQTRANSSQVPEKEVSPHIGFYKTFSRPIAKVLLMATFTYQVAYWGWVYLEKGEIKAQKTAELEGLEKELKGLTDAKAKPETSRP